MSDHRAADDLPSDPSGEHAECGEARVIKTMRRRAGEIRQRALHNEALQWHIARYRGDIYDESYPEEEVILALRHVVDLLGVSRDELMQLIFYDNFPHDLYFGEYVFKYEEVIDHMESRDRRRLRYLHVEHHEPHPHCEICRKEARRVA